MTRRWVFAVLAVLVSLQTGCCRMWDRWCGHGYGGGGGYCAPNNCCNPCGYGGNYTGGSQGYIPPTACPPPAANYPGDGFRPNVR